MPNQRQQICNQLIENEDLLLIEETLTQLRKEGVAIEILANPSIVKIYAYTKRTLSDIIPIMHDFGFLVNNEISFVLTSKQESIHVTKLSLDLENSMLLKKHANHIKQILLFALTQEKKASCALFALAYTQNFCLHSIFLFRTITHYENQLVAEFNIPKIIKTLTTYHTITKLFLRYFNAKFDPFVKNRDQTLGVVETKIYESFKEVQNSDDDRILKLFFEILKSMLRTNYYLQKSTIAIKIDLQYLKPYLKGIQPTLETYVYHQDFRGTHLRMGAIARGGLRYSNRKDDYRIEIKSLMAAQEGKNAIIIPSGAKGGFVIDTPKAKLTQEAFTNYYSLFIEALLDMVDNKIKGEIITHPKIVSYDEADTYFVVAADRGTANMSDTANAIAQQRGFWIKDAFASGGSNGFHHKKLGITAKGALKSVERFFLEKGINFYEEPITVVGIGSMGGDVFGNGMLQSQHFKLIGAISHDEIFIDPDPNPQIAFKERQRLFESKAHKWSDYDSTKLSEGGGVFKRSQRDITLSPQIKTLLGTTKNTLDGEEIANALLKLPVDMLYNGGVGTYIKSSEESNLEVGDNENEYVRADANEIQAFCICEGGNLGLTQKARYEYALNGGKVHLDSIDNAAGVNTSDHEVNLKIILNSLVEKEFITNKKKSQILKEMTPHVINSVLWTNYFQALSIALEEERSKEHQSAFINVVNLLEKSLDVFQRRYFSIPKDIDFNEVITKKGTIIRPVLAVILLYAKIFLKKILNQSNLYEGENFFHKYLMKYFPKEFVILYEDAIFNHPLKNEIISMIIANKIIDHYGATFLEDYEELGEEKFLLKIKAYLITNQLYSANDVRFEIYRNDYDISTQKQYTLLLEIEKKIEYNIKWMLRNLKQEEFCFETILDYKNAIDAVSKKINITTKTFVPNNQYINTFFSHLNYLKFSPAIIKITKQTAAPFERCAFTFYHIVEIFDIPLLIEQIEYLKSKEPNELLLQEQLQLLIEHLLIDLTTELLSYQRSGEAIESAFKNYLKEHQFNMKKYKIMVEYLNKNENSDISDLTVIVNYLLLIKG